MIFTVRKFVNSNIGWFYETRNTIGEHGRERAVNINSPVFEQWFPEGVSTPRVNINTRYFQGNGAELSNEIVKDIGRPIANQGGGKNWRLAGEAIPGQYYGSIRTGDLMLMMFDRKERLLSWICVRKESDDTRTISKVEEQTYESILNILGNPNADRNMWLPESAKVPLIISKAKSVHPLAGELLLEMSYIHEKWQEANKSNGLEVSSILSTRFISSLLTKQFVILTGMTGSGKTRLAQSFAHWLSASSKQYEVISVGADWIGNENILGYADALDKSNYVSTSVLELILRADTYKELPHFLVFDEMNLSHVERYFSDFLSSMESGEPINLYSGSEQRGHIPYKITLPPNLFVIGTINVDETTYSFSPKVLDRANVIEFRVSEEMLSSFLENPFTKVTEVSSGSGANFGESFIEMIKSPGRLDNDTMQQLKIELLMFFRVLSKFNLEFGFRTAKEITRFFYMHKNVVGPNWDFHSGMDAQCIQKMLPKISGSRKKIEPILAALGILCFHERKWKINQGIVELENLEELVSLALQAGKLQDQELYLLFEGSEGLKYPIENAQYKLSFDKITRMLLQLEQQGFTSFSEG